MAGGIDITARYVIRCDSCGVAAEPGPDPAVPVEYHTFHDALAARNRVAQFEGWLLRWIETFPNLLCPECAANPAVLPQG